MINGTHQQMLIETIPPGAKIGLDDKYIGDSPIDIRLKRIKNHVLTVQKDSISKTINLNKQFNNYYLWIDLIWFCVGGIIFPPIDFMTGAWYSFGDDLSNRLNINLIDEKIPISYKTDYPVYVDVSIDEFEKVKKYYQKDCTCHPNILYRSNLEVDMNICLVYSLSDSANPLLAWLHVSYTGNDWIFIPEGGSLKFIVDDSLITLNSIEESRRSVLSGGAVLEQVHYDIDKETMLRIASGKTIKARLYVIDFEIPEKMKSQWLTFINEYWKVREEI